MTDKKKFQILEVDIHEADIYSTKFENNNFFTTPKNFYEAGLKMNWWVVFKNKEPLCIWPIYLNDHERVELPFFSYYFGPVWSQYFNKLSNHSILSKRNEILEIFLNKFKTLYKNLVFEFDYQNLDVRYFIWFNKVNQKKFKISPKYTSLIKNLDNKSKNEILENFRTLRKRMIKKFSNNFNFLKDDKFSFDEIINLYNDTILKKKNSLNVESKKFIEIFHKLSEKNNNCNLIGYRDKKNNKPAAIIMIANEKKYANLILNLTSFEHKESGISAHNMLEAINFAKEKGCIQFDFNGANSEIGANDKDSYGGISRLYFQIELN